MIIATLKDAEQYYHHNKRMQRAFEFIKETNLETLEVGKYLIDGDNIFASVQAYNTKLETECRFESHRRYIDIQVIINGIAVDKPSYVKKVVLKAALT